MNKKDFLNELEKRLSILNEQERKETIDEYRDIIEEKVKHGKTVKEAIDEFGSLDELTKEILSAYKIDPEYTKKQSDIGQDFGKVVDDCETLIKKGAQKLSDFTNETVKDFKRTNREVTPELIFEILIKIVILLIILALLKIPFYLIGNFGTNIFGFSISPFDGMISFIWKLISFALYICFCIMIGVVMFKQYFTGGERMEQEMKNNTKEEKKETKTTKITKTASETTKAEEKKETVVKKPEPQVIIRTTFSDVLMMVAKILIILFIVIPMIFVEIGIFVGLAATIFFLIEGLNLWGLLLGLVGIGIIGIFLIRLICDLLAEQKRKRSFLPFVLGAVMTIAGTMLFVNMLFHFSYYDELPKNQNFVMTTETSVEPIKDNRIEVNTYYGDTEVIQDNTTPQGQLVIETSYYKDFSTVRVTREAQNRTNCDGYDDNYQCLNETTEVIDNLHVYLDHSQDHSILGSKLTKYVMNDLKHNRLYNYDDLYQAHIKVHVNPLDVNKVIAN